MVRTVREARTVGSQALGRPLVTIAWPGGAVSAVLRVAALALMLAIGWPVLSPGQSRAEARVEAMAEPTSRFEATLAARLDRVIDSRGLSRARVSALVVRASDGKVLYSRDPDRALTPASNMKILTAMAVLDAFGPSHRFETPVLSDAPLLADGSVSNLYIRGSGDPAINSEDWWRLAAKLRAAGLTRVRGNLVLDPSRFDGERWHPGWGPVSSRAYHAPVAGVMANYSSFAVTVEPGTRAGAAVRVGVTPPVPYLRVVNRARTGAKGTRSSLVVDRSEASRGEIVSVNGSVGAGRPAKTYWLSVADPTRYAGAILRMQLEGLGVVVDGEVVVGPSPSGATELLRFKGRPVAEIVRLFVKWSNNAVAESLVKALGAKDRGEGSWKAGVLALRDRLELMGVPLEGTTIVDGSGLSYDAKLSPRTLVSALRIARSSFAIGPELLGALPIAGRDGTLEKRAERAGGLVRAKTGLLTRVTALSGYARGGAREDSDGGAGSDLVFSILTNGYRAGDDAAMSALDWFVAELVAR